MKRAFTFLLCIHGIIHLIGFVKAFFSTETTKQVLGIPKVIGAFWLIVFVMFTVTAVVFFNHKRWFFIAFITLFISQILIISVWNEAKFGTVLNFIILIVGITAYGNYRFQKMVQNESFVLFQNIQTTNTTIITSENITHLPEIVQKWIINSGVVGKQNTFSVRLKQKGQMKTKPKSKWMSFTAKQYFNVESPAFLWVTKVENNPVVYMVGRDKLFSGKGSMLIKLLALIPVVKESESKKLNSGTMQRFLSEICWFPSAALNNYLKWESVDYTSAKAILTIGNNSVSGVFKFNTEGDILAFETNRDFGGNEDAKLEKWIINMIDYKVFDGFKVPNKCQVTWRLKEDDFNWLNLEIIDLKYNTIKPYETQ